MIKLYDSLYLTECETDNTKTDVLLSETNGVKKVWDEVKKVIKLCEEKYHTKSFYTRELLLGNTESRWNEENTEIVVIRTYNKWYLGIDWGSHSHFIKIVFDTETEYNDFLTYQQARDDENEETN